jgi:lipid A 3-O-deacylase
LTRNLKLLLLFLITTSLGAVAEPSGGAASGGNTLAESPVAQARNARLWEMGPFAYWGVGIGNRSQYKFFAPGFQIGKPVTPVLHAGILSGQFELAGNIQPLWQAYTPGPHNQLFQCIEPGGTTFPCELPVGGGTFTGFSITPVIFRWNFLTHSERLQPWFQGAGGLIYTTHKYPPDVLMPHGLPGGTSVWNFSPQGGIGVHWFTRRKRSVDLAVNAVHISSASLGDRNPGVNASLQVQVGYTWWK